MRRLFIYYRVDAARAEEALPLVLDFQRRACARHPGLQAELLKRPGEKDGLQTWMEVYSSLGGVPSEVEAELSDSAGRSAISGILSNLYVEVFVPCAS